MHFTSYFKIAFFIISIIVATSFAFWFFNQLLSSRYYHWCFILDPYVSIHSIGNKSALQDLRCFRLSIRFSVKESRCTWWARKESRPDISNRRSCRVKTERIVKICTGVHELNCLFTKCFYNFLKYISYSPWLTYSWLMDVTILKMS